MRVKIFGSGRVALIRETTCSTIRPISSLRRRSDYTIRLANGDVTFLADTEGNGGVNLFGEFTVEPDQTPAAQ